MTGNRSYLILLASIAIVLAGCGDKAPTWESNSAALDGKTYAIELIGSDGKPMPDRLIFFGKTCDSTACRAFGFTKTSYAVQTGDTTKWKVDATSPTAGTNHWEAEIKGDAISGTMVATKDGKKSEYKFSGKVLPSLYKRLGEEKAIAAVSSELIDRLNVNDLLNANPKIDAARKKVNNDELKAKLTAFVCVATGGPQKYKGRTMKETHKDMNISGKEWDEMAKVFGAVLDSFKVPKEEQSELFGIVGTTKSAIVKRPDE